MGGKCDSGNHKWKGCTCEVCGERRNSDHDYVVIERVAKDPDPCCWDPDEPCMGNQCGAHCFQYYPGKGGPETITERCSICGDERHYTIMSV